EGAWLQADAAAEGIRIVGTVDGALRLQQPCARVDRSRQRQPVIDIGVADVMPRIAVLIANAADRIADITGAKNRNHQIGSDADAPLAERLAEIAVVL